MAEKTSIFNLQSPLKGFFDKAFRGPSPICESAFDVGETVPFRLEKTNVLHLFKKLRNFVQVKSALLSRKSEIPDWGRGVYPFAAITGASLSSPKAAASGHEGSHLERLYDEHKDEVDVAVTLMATRSVGIPPDAVMFYHQIDITNKKQLNRAYGDPLRPGNDRAANSIYAKISPQYLAQQAYDIDENGRMFVNPNKKNPSVMRPVGYTKSRYMCKLVRLVPTDVSSACGIYDVASCVRFLRNIGPLMRSGNRGTTPFGNPEYGNFEPYFRSKDCLDDDGKVNVDAYASLLESGAVAPSEFVSEVLMKTWMLSDYRKTYVWVPLANPRAKPYSEKDVEVTKKILSGDVSESVNEAGEGDGKTPSDVEGEDWAEVFFNAIVSSARHSFKKVLTFATRGSGKKVVPLGAAAVKRAGQIALAYGSVNLRREFIAIDDVLEDGSDLDFGEIFSDPSVSKLFSPEADRSFLCKRISGHIFGFPFNAEIEEERYEKGLSDSDFYGKYLYENGMDEKTSTGFYVTLVCPRSKSSDGGGYFLFTGYDAPENPTSAKFGDAPECLERLVPSDDNNLMSVIWYNDPTSKSKGKIEMPTAARTAKTDAKGRSIGYRGSDSVSGTRNVDSEYNLKTTYRK